MPKIEKILLPADVAKSDDEYAAVDWLGRFCGKLVTGGPYEWNDLPALARAFTELDEYAGQVANGGHMQYVTNHHWDDARLRACRAGLEMISRGLFHEIFDAAVTVMESDPARRDRFRAAHVRGWSQAELADVEKAMQALDQRFFREARGPQALHRAMADALTESSEVELVASDWSESVRTLVAAGRHAKAADGSASEIEVRQGKLRAVLRQLLDNALQGTGRRMEREPAGYVSVHIFRGNPVWGLTVLTDKGRCQFLIVADGVMLRDMAEDRVIAGIRVQGDFDHRAFAGLPL